MTPHLSDLLSRIATAYDALPHTPHDSAVVTAYDAFKRALLSQYRTIPYRIIFTDTDPYPDSASMFREVGNTNMLRVYTGSDLPDEHPTSRLVSLPATTYNHRAGDWKGISDKPLPINYNLLFRAVHDALVHIPYRLSFGPIGEFKAFQTHARMLGAYTPGGRISFDSVRALATETLAQNAWFNTRGGRKTFAPQKACLLPDSLIIEALELRI